MKCVRTMLYEQLILLSNLIFDLQVAKPRDPRTAGLRFVSCRQSKMSLLLYAAHHPR